MGNRIFKAHGEICASHPWEVIVATFTLTLCLLTVDSKPSTISPGKSVPSCDWDQNCVGMDEYNAADMIMMTIIRCTAILYSYYHFCNLHKLGSKYILGISGLFTVFSSFVFSSTVINFMNGDISDLKDALFFFLLLIDLSKATLLAQFALSSSSPEEVKHNIAKGMAKLGPIITLDTLVETLVIGVGTLSGVRRLEVLCGFACMSVVVNYIVFMTFYPACLSLILELSRIGEKGRIMWQNKFMVFKALTEEQEKPNPVVQRVKIIMSAGLMIVHARSRWTFQPEEEEMVSPLAVVDHMLPLNATGEPLLHYNIMRWITVNADQIVILVLLFAVTIKFVLFEEKEQHFFKPNVITDEVKNVNNDSSSPETQETETDSKLLFNSESISEVFSDSLEDKQVKIDKQIQTEMVKPGFDNNSKTLAETKVTELPVKNSDRDLDECIKLFKELGAEALSDDEVMRLVRNKQIAAYQLEKAVNDPERGVGIRRKIVSSDGNFREALENLPYTNYDYSLVMGACCENVIGYVPVPVGVAGPLLLDGKLVYVPMATTEGCLVASTNRGSRALLKCGVISRVVSDGMTRGPVIRFPNMARASEAMTWMQNPENFEILKASFDSSSRFARLSKIHIKIASRHLFVRFIAQTGDAMGMNMLSKGTEIALNTVKEHFSDMEILSLSGNFCADKKPAAVNWIEGRGKSVVAEAIVPADVVTNVLKTSVQALIDVNITKNLIGSAVAGSIGGFNAHAANIVTAIFIATGQDPAQNVGSSNCITLMEPWGDDGNDLYISCSMPSIEIGTVGGGTVLPPQSACLDMLGVKGSNEKNPGENACKLARIVCGTVLAGELSLMSALAAGHLVRSHLKHNRSSTKGSTEHCMAKS
ncbi:3-hydroxy-3-methylglutaryl-coenzyme A reductase, putative [Pediculus humanus corporis]|uniref:3-hydroxy-3-methylglutaryl coenzyme A reductase n=1 Tax=Pediculus humanus subsp. corporis TaxID=121224 RepID=E0VQY1_PEDHC|nr:3-hydroxy-3-methylglutaryl-coenzyme A reductase, putative [Pediculus humanus corporis]EEB15787.1 3-hydroxy-3-methylglutaryl-coenzyme A reductase, putative [Pediculus humanus corporis]